MVNPQLFKTRRGVLPPQATALNHEQAPAYTPSAKHRLAQLAATGCLNQTFYADADAQLDAVTALAATVDPVFVAQTAVYARQAGHMKDMPVLLAALLADIQPYATTQAAERRDIMNVGGFSDAVFSMVAMFAEGRTGVEHWVGEIEKIPVDPQ